MAKRYKLSDPELVQHRSSIGGGVCYRPTRITGRTRIPGSRIGNQPQTVISRSFIERGRWNRRKRGSRVKHQSHPVSGTPGPRIQQTIAHASGPRQPIGHRLTIEIPRECRYGRTLKSEGYPLRSDALGLSAGAGLPSVSLLGGTADLSGACVRDTVS